MAKLSSGEPQNTTSGAELTLIANATGLAVRNVEIVNNGSIAGLCSIDNGVTWWDLPAEAARQFPLAEAEAVVVKVKPASVGTDLSNVSAAAW